MKKNEFSCFIIGEDNLHIQCAKILKEQGHSILGVISPLEASENWAFENNIPYFSSLASAKDVLEKTSFDYLFSIVNSQILFPSLLKLPRQFAINFHDALLPKYAGVHATSWAIFNQEKTHGITWHVMSELVDTGDILKQYAFEVAQDETALSLNLKCYEHALSAFKELVDEFTDHTYHCIPQDLSLRTYYGYSKKLVGNGWIAWHENAEIIDRMCRALDLGHYDNRLGTLKFTLGASVFIVRKLEILAEKSGEPAGTVIDISEDSWRIATGTQDIALLKVSRLAGQLCSLDKLAQRYKITKGSGLASPDPDFRKEFSTVSTDYFKYEAFWVQQLQSYKSAEISFLPSVSASNRRKEIPCFQQWELPAALWPSFEAYTLFAVWLVYLYRLGNRENLGVMFSHPSLMAWPNEITCFISPVIPFSIALQPDMNFRDVLQALDTQIALIVEQGSYLRDITARYHSLLHAKRRYAITVMIVDQFDISAHLADATTPLVLMITADGKKLGWFVDPKALKKEPYLKKIMENMPGHLQILTSGITEDPNSAIKDLPLLTSEERQQILIEWNHTETDYPKDKTIHQLFEEQVEKTPNNIAVCYENNSLTYSALNKKANQLAHYLMNAGVTLETAVGIYAERSIEMIVAVLATLKAGGTYVPLDPVNPASRTQWMLEDSEIKIIITPGKSLDLPKKFEPIIHLETDYSVIQNMVNTNPINKATATNLACIMYTSGSTGKPKGVEILHRGVVRLVRNTNYVNFDAKDSIAHVSNPSFDAAMFEVWGALLNGGKLIILSRADVLNAPIFEKKLIQHSINTIWLTSALFNQIVHMDMIFPPSLKNLLIGGEPLCVKTVKKIMHSKNKPERLINGYGPTENTTFTSYYEIKKISKNLKSIPIGKPISNTQVYVLDAQGQPMPIGFVGELQVAGDGLARGYKNRLQLTEKAFVHHPYLKNSDTRLYKTGDLVRWLPTGDLEFIGRVDGLIKIRGFRIDPAEVEVVLARHPSISQAKLVVKKNKNTAHKELAAFLQKKSYGSQLALHDIKTFLRMRLPHYMRPTVFYELDKLPLTENGKLDTTKLLKLMETMPPLAIRDSTPPKNKKQKILKEVFEKVFKCPVGIHDDFFNLGGDSILAMQICAKARKYMDVAVKHIFTYPSIAQLAMQVQFIRHRKKKHTQSLGFVPLTPIQHWFFSQSFYKQECFSQACLLEVPGASSLRLDAVISLLFHHYDAFRLRFKKSKQGWSQYYEAVSQNTVSLVEEISLPSLSTKELDDIVQDLIQVAQASFDLEKGPVMRCYFIHSKDSTPPLFLMIVHHLIMDGVSWRILLENIERLYQVEDTYQQRLVSSDTFQDWAKAAKKYRSSAELQVTQAYWQHICEKSPGILLDYTGGENVEESSAVVEISFTTQETDCLLHQLTQLQDARVNEILITLFAGVLSEWLNMEDICIDLESHGRADILSVDVSHTLGWFTSLFPMRIRYNTSKTIDANIAAVKEQLHAIPHYGIDYGILRYLAEVEKLEYTPQVSFNYWGQFDHMFSKNSGFKYKWLKLASHPKNLRTHILNIEAVIHNGQLQLQWVYSKNLHHETTIKKLADQYHCLLKIMLHEIMSSATADRDTPHIPYQKHDEQLSHTYLLTSLQKGLLFQTISNPNSEAYMVQFHWKLASTLHTPTLKHAFQLLIDRHDILRTRFVWKNVREPLQMVEKRTELLWQTYDWQIFSTDDQPKRLEDFLSMDRQAGFSLDEAPLLRATLIQTGFNGYWIVLTSHHILLDGWSMSLLLGELGVIYQSLVQPCAIELLAPPSYANYIHWLHNQNLETAEIFWRNYLKDITNPGLLSHTAVFKPSRPQELYQHDSKTVSLSLALSHEVRQFLKMHRFTLSTFFYGIWGLLLHRYTQCDDVLFGTTVSLRPAAIPDAERMLGLMVNTLPFRVMFQAHCPVLDYLSEIQSNSLELLDYGYAPLTHIQTWGPTNISSDELFDTLVVIENYPISTIIGLNLQFHDITIVDPTHYPLTLAIIPDDQISLKFAYNTNSIGLEMLYSLIGHIQVLIKEFLHKPYQSIHALHLLSQQEYQQTIVDWNPTPLLSDIQHSSMPALFEQQVMKTPDRLALVFESQSLTYLELNNQANQFAHFLKKQGMQPEHLVGLYIERSVEMIVSILAILKMGAAYVPLDPAYPLARIEYILKDCAAPFIITHTSLSQNIDLFDYGKIKIIYLDGGREGIAQQSIANLPDVDADSLAYVIYTSGSTGNPKGTLIEHQNVTRLFKATESLFHFNEHDCWTLFHSFNFDFSVWEIFGALFYGGKLIIVPSKIQKTLEDFYELISEQKVTVLNMTPGVFYKLITIDQKCLKKLALRYIIFGGEALSVKPLEAWFNTHGYESPQLINMYGITETTVFVTNYFIQKNVGNNLPYYAIGKPFTDRFVCVLDKYLKPLPVNIVGELFVGGGLARSYLNRDELTSQKFIDYPLSKNNASRLYRSGDLVKWVADGNLEYVGRMDDQIKIRGFRIELGEVQAKIEEHPNVKQAAVIVAENDTSQKFIAAYVVKKDNNLLDAVILRDYLVKFLPHYMIPSTFIFLAGIPLTLNGKLDKNALPDPNEGARVQSEYLPPSSPVETAIVHIWSKALGFSRISINDNFFDLGGDSFSVLEVISLAHVEFDVDVSLQDFVHNPTVFGLAERVTQLQHEKNAFILATQTNLESYFLSCLIPLQPNGTKRPLFLIHPIGGTVFWYISLVKYLDPDQPLYAIQDPGVEMDNIRFDSIEEMATFYLEAIRSIQPEGPYLLGGASGGATISVEIVRQLEETNEEAAFIALLDGWAPFPEKLQNQAFFEANMRRQYHKMHNKFLTKGIKRAELLLALQWQRSQLIASYQVPVLNHRLTLFKAMETMDVFQSIEAHLNHWENYSTQGVDLHSVPGNHETMFEEPQIQALAQQINQCLSELPFPKYLLQATQVIDDPISWS